ncbi:MAG: universal stress protein [Acidimicrobiales bacterium]
MSQAIPRDDARDVVAPAGRFRVYIGAAPGVGKTCAMLSEGNRRLRRGTDVVIGFAESYGRPYTESLAANLEVVPRKTVDYQGARFEEMDLDAIVSRAPTVALVDELAHTNVPGSGRNAKRWQDVVELLEAGISVISTMNIQHLESIADAVEGITGVLVRERVPDWVVRKADQIELIDSSPEQLRRRLLHGNIYPPSRVADALGNFFRPGNLSALRELALRFVADETEEEMLDYLRRHSIDKTWETSERILVGVTGAASTDTVLRRAARIAARTKGELIALHIVTGEEPPGASAKLDKIRSLANDLGARWEEIAVEDAPSGLVEFARSHHITQIVVGSTRRSRMEELTRGSFIRKVLRDAAGVGIDVHVIARRSWS